MLKRFVFAAALFTAVLLFGGAAQAGLDADIDEKRHEAEEAAREITAMRSERARSIAGAEGAATFDTFKRVCGPVSKRAKEIAKKTGFKLRHAAVKNRNPKNAATAEEAALIERFDKERGLTGLWERTAKDATGRERYAMPIFVEPGCMACHGPKDKRPVFIKEKYPGDKAYGFRPGDIRGIITVTLPGDQPAPRNSSTGP